MDISKIKLYPWQKNIIEFIENHEKYISEEDKQSLSTYDLNRLSRIQVSLPSGSGHSTLASYLLFKYNCAILYTSMNSLLDVLGQVEATFDDFYESDSVALNLFEFNHYAFTNKDINVRNTHKLESFSNLKKKISEKKVVIIDDATSVMEVFKPALDVVFNTSTGAIVLLG